MGCGSGRIGELALEAGSSHYVGIDFSEPMIELARARLQRFHDRTQLILGDFLACPLEGEFDVVLALGLFDYLPDPRPFTKRIFELTAPRGCLVGSFPAWSPLKGPIRKIRYEVIGDCPIFNYSRRGLEALMRDSGFARIDIRAPGKSGFLLLAHKR